MALRIDKKRNTYITISLKHCAKTIQANRYFRDIMDHKNVIMFKNSRYIFVS